MARNSSTRWYAALAVLIVFILLAWLLGAVLTLTEGERVTLRVGLVALGLLGAVALLWFLRPRDEALEVKEEAGDDVLPLVNGARSRIGRATFDAKPLVLVLGPTGSCKTTVVMRSGTDPELLAGDAAAGSDVPPKTAVANFWLVRDAILAEASGTTFADEKKWGRLVRALRAPRVAAAVGRGEAAPRVAVVCVPCDLFKTADAAAQVDALARLTRERLSDAARAWGMSVPVYVILTKADRVPKFESWAAPLTREEVKVPLGAAFPFDVTATATSRESAAAVGTYAERIVPRVESAMASIAAMLAGHRVAFLGRESQAEQRLQAYELPREIGKLAPDLTRFLVEICRPVHSGVSPQLRGVYFVGARPVTVEVPVGGAPEQPASAPRAEASSATNVFSPQAMAAARGAAAAPARTMTKRVPQWIFVERLFPEVFLADRGAAAMARGGVRVSSVRRGLLGAGIAAALLLSLGTLRAWSGNRTLVSRATAAARDVAVLPVVNGPVAFPSADALRRLEALRVVLDTLLTYQKEGVPSRLGWGLWVGDDLLAATRRTWLDGYRRQLHDVAAGALVDSLKALPELPRPTDEYGADYAMLKAYLVTTSEWSHSSPDFLAPVLLTSWGRGQAIDADIAALARRQFETYATLLSAGNPWPGDADARIVGRTRLFLTRFSGTEQIYANMVAKADKAAPAIKLAEAVPQGAGIINAPAQVDGAYTAPGWKFMQDAFQNSDAYFEGEKWVVGDATAAQTQDRDKVLADLRARYRADYVQKWRGFVRATSVTRASNVRDAATKMGALGGAQSPLLAVLALVARNTKVDSAMTAAFQPVHAVVAADDPTKYISDANQPYVTSLSGLQAILEQIGNLKAATDTASAMELQQKAQEALAQVPPAKGAARQLAQKFAIDTAAAKVGPAVAALLEAPINAVESVLKGVRDTRIPTARVAAPAGGGGGGGGGAAAAGGGGGGGGAPNAQKIAELAAELNARGQAICQAMTPMLSKFPFNPDAGIEATVADVQGLLAPGTGQLAAFEQERLGDFMEKQGGQWVAKPGKLPALSAPFLTFFNKAMQVSAALFNGGAAPRIVFTAHGAASQATPLITLVQGTQVARFNQNTPPAQFIWPSSTGREARLHAQFGKNKEQLIAKAIGEWAMFRLVSASAKAEGDGGSIRFEWNATGKGAQPVAVEYVVEGGAPVFKRGWLGGMTCVPQVTR